MFGKSSEVIHYTTLDPDFKSQFQIPTLDSDFKSQFQIPTLDPNFCDKVTNDQSEWQNLAFRFYFPGGLLSNILQILIDLSLPLDNDRLSD